MFIFGRPDLAVPSKKYYVCSDVTYLETNWLYVDMKEWKKWDKND